MSLRAYRPVGFDHGGPVGYGWSVFWEASAESREEITGGWTRRADAVRHAMDAIDARAARNALAVEGSAGPLALGERARCCEHGHDRHAPGRYTPTRCTARGCACGMYVRGPLVSVLAGDVPVGARVWAYTQRHGAVERRALRREEAAAADGSPLVRLTVEGVDGRERWDFQAGATVFLLSGDVPEGTPIVP